MNAVTRFGIAALFLIGTCIVIAGGTANGDATPRIVKVAIVDNCRDPAVRDATHVAFALSLSDAMSKARGSAVSVKIKCVNADHAAFNLGAAVYDAVFVLAPSLPRPLVLSDVTRLSATLGAGKNEKKAYLVFGALETALGDQLAASFGSALADDRFLAAYAVESRVDRPAGGARVAGARVGTAR